MNDKETPVQDSAAPNLGYIFPKDDFVLSNRLRVAINDYVAELSLGKDANIDIQDFFKYISDTYPPIVPSLWNHVSGMRDNKTPMYFEKKPTLLSNYLDNIDDKTQDIVVVGDLVMDVTPPRRFRHIIVYGHIFQNVDIGSILYLECDQLFCYGIDALRTVINVTGFTTAGTVLLGGLSYKGVTQRGFITHQNLEYTHEDHNR